ncbi:winged helix-turn-helix domain-containing protein [Sphingobacterium hotanense]|uniref:Winged helix-turn-helix transcriptional regulator n=1 Tax=Sphingobacterium hotanense TaxID=649196 RepID=A0ABT7NLA6_9SPHI|nr:winged helix-turn-helix domain-containing protein [Sphingobacterium hotanense]MDM1047930.1 winged helix-turn-helix transcriptional regulator [Sphingobacterium hotanense]
MLDSLITSKTRLKLLIKFFVSASNKGYLRGIAEEFNESTNAVRKELNQLTDAGYLNRNQENQRIYYRANTQHPLFDSLQNLVRKYLGIDKAIEHMLEKSGDIEQVCLLGDYAKGVDSGTIEVMVLGTAIDVEYLTQLGAKIETQLDKKIMIYFEKQSEVQQQIILFEKEDHR